MLLYVISLPVLFIYLTNSLSQNCFEGTSSLRSEIRKMYITLLHYVVTLFLLQNINQGKYIQCSRDKHKYTAVTIIIDTVP